LANVAELEGRAADLANMIKTMRRLARTSEQRSRQRATPPSPAKRAGRR
jgi:hypothetical protein